MKKIVRPDRQNTDPEYWERVLKSHGLGIRPEAPHEDDPDIKIPPLKEADDE